MASFVSSISDYTSKRITLEGLVEMLCVLFYDNPGLLHQSKYFFEDQPQEVQAFEFLATIQYYALGWHN